MSFPPIDDPAHDSLAVELGRVILWERAQLPPVLLGQCEEPYHARAIHSRIRRCQTIGFLTALALPTEERFLCPRHGATLERAVRRWPR